ncbi:MAG: hypothetical protein AAGD12_04695 [Pseudomonadota bacterium]
MIRTTLLGAATASVLVLQPSVTSAQDASAAAQFVQNTLRAYTVLVLRSVIDFTYESLSYDPLSGMVATGVKIYPPLDWLEGEEECAISIGRMSLTGGLTSDAISEVIEVTDLTIPPICLEEEPREFLAGIGYDGVTMDAAVIDLAYDLPSSGLTLAIQASLPDAASLDVAADFSYFWFAGLIDNDPYPLIQLSRAEISIKNAGAWERFTPMIEGMVGSVDSIPSMAVGGLTGELTNGGSRPLRSYELAFVESLESALTTFLAEKSRITVTMAPPGGVWLDEFLFDGPDVLIEALQPVMSNGPHSVTSMISLQLLNDALTAGDKLSLAQALEAGRALMTGVGAPRNRAVAIELLVPRAAQNWNAEAALILAEGLYDAGDNAAAYPYALVALAGGETSALSVAAQIEAGLDPASIQQTQDVILANYPEDPGLSTGTSDLSANPDIAEMRSLALALRQGLGVPRNYALAYLWASLAAAGGDLVAANLRDDLDEMTEVDGGAVWRESFDAASAEALVLWSQSGIGEKIEAATAN